LIEVNQDPLGECGNVIKQADNNFIMYKNMADGSIALGLFNRGKTDTEMTIDWSGINISGKHKVRDLWRQTNLGISDLKFSASVPAQGVVMIKISK
jgi:alpha-galactosidase